MVPLVANHWYDLGLQLLDPKYENELNIIEEDAKNDARTCCRKMFSKWLTTDKLASWDKVIEALTLIGLDNVASNIKLLLGQGESLKEHSDAPLLLAGAYCGTYELLLLGNGIASQYLMVEHHFYLSTLRLIFM